MPEDYSVFLTYEAKEQLNCFDKSIRERIKKRLSSLSVCKDKRTLKKHPDIWVLEIGQYRALYLVDVQKKTKTVFFIADHKEYEKKYLRM